MDTIGAYEVLGEVGRGGMATVFKAYHRPLNRHVAIKMIHQAQVEDNTFRVRFAREAQIVAALHHPNIVPVYDFSEYEGDPYLVMQFIDGCSLKTILADGPIEITDVLNIIKPIASAIDYAHKQGVLHRDIKPANILLDLDGTPYLSDFGLARFSQQGATSMSADMLIGTPFYMSPEQGRGVANLDSRTDIYSFGVVMYELLVGTVPYSEGSPISIIHDHIYHPLPLPSTLNPKVPLTVEAVLLRALAKDPDDRYETATRVADELSEVLQGLNSFALRSEAVHSAAHSLAKPRPALRSVSLRKAQQPTVASPQTKSRRRIGIAAALVALIVLVPLIWFALQGVSNRNLPTVTTSGDTAITLRNLSINDASAALAADATNPVAYLELFKAYTLMGPQSLRNAMETFEAGWEHAPDPVAYTQAAVNVTVDARRLEMGFAVYARAFALAQDNDALRDGLGRPFYDAAVHASTQNRDFVTNMRRDIENMPNSPIGFIMFARLFIYAGELETAETLLDLIQNTTLPEAHLMLGELYAAQNRLDEARAEWESVRDNADAPQWVRQRAEELIQN